MSKLLADKTLDPISGTSAYIPTNPTSTSPDPYLNMAERIISNILAVLSIVGAIMFSVNFILGGINWITAGGDKGKIDTAKKQMTGAAIGLIVIAASYAITYIVGLVTGINILEPAQLIKDMMS